MGLIRYSCGHISGSHKPIHVKFGVKWNGNENAEMRKRKFDDVNFGTYSNRNPDSKRTLTLLELNVFIVCD